MLCYFVCERKVFVEQAVKRIRCKLAGELRCKYKQMLRAVGKGKSVRKILTHTRSKSICKLHRLRICWNLSAFEKCKKTL